MSGFKLFRVSAVPIPTDDYLGQRAARPYFRDALAAPVSNKSLTPGQLQNAIFTVMPLWVQALMALRNRIVGVLGFEVGRTFTDDRSVFPPRDLQVGDAVAFMHVIHADASEVVSFTEDKHMQFYLSVSKQGEQVVVSTLVNLKTLTGRLYMAMIKPFHWLIARVVIHNAVKDGRI
ncbi:DUF2867 domain-containing protein [Hahella sp. CR1]|uniref:DUF2867 domain-containing protein n=1 Tax=unclassified Hahella TaxID=2624107 RepID=UPI00244236EA|nr:DUF2867 domain-containing protein [Hahella sp. CR1]MDG9667742.1 DUF2867 domain-containing protein [Hahella sp. CR1]